MAIRRSTRQRRLVYDTVMSTESHPTAEWVYEAVRRALPRISLGTVYRNLQLLVADGLLRSFSRDGRIRYDGDLAPHDHFVCVSCGLLMDIPRGAEALPAEKRLRSRGFAVQGRNLEIHGICRSCRRRPNKGGENRWVSSPTPRHTRT